MKLPGHSVSRVALALTVVLSAFSLAPCEAFAQTRSAVKSELVFKAPSSCPSRGELLRRISARLPTATFDAARPTTSFLVTIENEALSSSEQPTFKAEMESAGPSGPQRRELRAPTCGELVDAVALMIALTLDAENTKEATPDPPRPSPLPEAPPPRYVPFLRLGLGTELGTLPHPALGAALAIGLEHYERSQTSALVRPSFALEPSVFTSDLLAPTPSRGSYTRFGLRAEACPIRVALGSAFSLRPCAFVGLGAIRAEGTAAPIPTTEVILWSDLGAVVRARAEVGAVFFEIGGGVVVPMTRPNYVLQSPRVVVYETPPVGGTLGLFGGLRFL